MFSMMLCFRECFLVSPLDTNTPGATTANRMQLIAARGDHSCCYLGHCARTANEAYFFPPTFLKGALLKLGPALREPRVWGRYS